MHVESRDAARELLQFIDRSPSPWHAAANMAQELRAAGFRELSEAQPWDLQAGQDYFVRRDDSSLVAFRVGKLPGSSLRIVGAHTDSPGFRVKPQPIIASDGMLRLAVEVYGGPIIPSFTDRELGLAGRVHYRTADGIVRRLVHIDRPLLRLQNVAIHLNRDVNEQGLKLQRQDQLQLLLGLEADEKAGLNAFRGLLAEQAGCDGADVLGWELAVVDTQPGAFFGMADEFIANGQLDNLASCHAGLRALLQASDAGTTRILACFDHEEVGSESYAGAGGNFLETVLERMRDALGVPPAEWAITCSDSLLLSADMAHAYHPAYPQLHDPQHRVYVNGGPVIKHNAAQRYATDGVGEAFFTALCQGLGLPVQHYVHRNDLPCGSTIGPMSAARLGLRTLDVGAAMWAMHSARESAGAADHLMMIRAMSGFYGADSIG
ncbi:M18 family aminopeptidase [Alkalilimnicola sp. S0819]|uniref:M18 family aminopeptidase n=1 Tax=Alkalilimnicola sp. S0819 TaxID=2613922 RepID=UPI001262A4FA|nr:M18 family aminopeptidase [Alkalilimnicola sp. S0819]KAB7622837.1 M18 family aminopeptidase [Alkalilimnicola sp. S0819]MPQ17159.1 M18 family aminopeptidase [Alkalilimnicola sp. S0819]